ncbi:MAG: HD domain-containing phosphohydrolase [Dehalococcoidia bacterium]
MGAIETLPTNGRPTQSRDDGVPRRRLRLWLGEAAHLALGPTEPAAQKQDVIRRAVVAAVVIAVLPIQKMHIPGWPVVVGACAVALAYDIGLAYLIFLKDRQFLARVLGLLLDALVLMLASLYVFHEMGAVDSASDIWLVFVVYVVSGGFSLAPVGSLVYTAVWMGWFAFGSLVFFPSDSAYQTELPIRLIFLGLIGLISLGVASELQKKHRRLEQQNRQTMGMLARLVEARDTDAGAHLHRIQFFSKALALYLGFSEREAQEIAYASMIHDVGKAHVPDIVLQKPGPLSPEEWKIMQKHTAWGDELLADNLDFETARQVARWHHERWDGSGYPDGIAGEQIPFVARIVAVADVFDALISKRPYKEAWPAETAIEETKRMAGSHLDPMVVESFVALWERGTIGEIVAEISEEPDTHELGARAA